MTKTNPNITGTSIINDPKSIYVVMELSRLLHLCRDGTVNFNYASRPTFDLCRYENSGTNSRTRLDIGLTKGNFNDEVLAMSLRSDGKVRIWTAVPYNNSDVYGTNAKFAIRASNEGESSTLYLGTGHIGRNVYKTALIAQGTGLNSRSKIHFGLNNVTNNTDSATVADARMTIRPDGNVGIANTDPGNILQVGAGAQLRIAKVIIRY
jgi:hypothetical protein